MQDASAEFEAAVAGHRTWVPPRLRTDWADDGFDGVGTIDDLSGQMEADWSVDHTLDDGYPDVVTFVSGASVPEFDAGLAGRADPATGAPITASAYWSPERTDSPVYGFERDIPPITFDVGLVTAAGVEYARIFTGQMVNTPVKGGRANLETISATRLALMSLVQPPAFIRQHALGLTSTWPVSYTLARCGLYAGPRPRASGTAWYSPQHGGAWDFTPGDNTVRTSLELAIQNQYQSWVGTVQYAGEGSSTAVAEHDWIDGPYLTAPSLQLTAAERRELYQIGVPLDTSQPDPFSASENKARLEMWVKGDATDVNNAPGGSGTVTGLCRFVGENAYGCTFRLGVNASRQVYAEVYDFINTRTLTSTGTLPTDGSWYFVGAAFDMTADRLWVNLNGTVESSSPSMSTVNLSDPLYWAPGKPQFVSCLPFAEATLTTGDEANVDDFPVWRSDSSFAPTALVHPSRVELAAVAYTEPVEAWKLIAAYAQAELASMRCNELDEFEYLPLSWWVQDEQQQIVDLFTTGLNAAPFDIDRDPTKIRNTVKVTYTPTTVPEFDVSSSTFRSIFELDTQAQISVPPGVTRLSVVFSSPGTALQQVFYVLSGTEVALFDEGTSYVTLNDASDGSGAYVNSPYVLCTLESWHAGGAVLRLSNTTNATWYLANDDNVPALRISGVPVMTASSYVVDRDLSAESVRRGERAVEVSATALQYEAEARRLARNVKMALRKPVATIGTDESGIAVTGNPLRQPGDLVQFRDTVTGIDDGLWRVRSVKHAGKGATYTQQVVARRVKSVGVVGQSNVGECLVGPGE
jgi:hypothetical protein